MSSYFIHISSIVSACHFHVVDNCMHKPRYPGNSSCKIHTYFVNKKCDSLFYVQWNKMVLPLFIELFLFFVYSSFYFSFTSWFMASRLDTKVIYITLLAPWILWVTRQGRACGTKLKYMRKRQIMRLRISIGDCNNWILRKEKKNYLHYYKICLLWLKS